METATVKKQTNRTIQRTHETYKKKSEINEALYLLANSKGIELNQSTLKLLGHFRHTDGGSTQISVSTWCKKVGISTSTYSENVLPELDGYFAEPLIITIQTTKIDKLGRKNKGTPYKVLQPLWKIKQLIEQKQKEISEQRADLMIQFVQSDITTDITTDITPNVEIPCESKDESTFLEEQNKSIRVNPLEKDLKDIKSIKKTDLFSPQPKKYGLKKEVKAILNQGILGGLHDEEKQEFGNRIQIALKKTNADITDEDIQETVFCACEDFIHHYDKGNGMIREDYFGALYVCIENALFDELILVEEENGEFILVENGNDVFFGKEDFDTYCDESDFPELIDFHEGKNGYQGEYLYENAKREAFKQYQLARVEIGATTELDELGIF